MHVIKIIAECIALFFIGVIVIAAVFAKALKREEKQATNPLNRGYYPEDKDIR